MKMATTTKLSVEVRQMPPISYLGKRFKAPLGNVGPMVSGAFAELYARLQETHSIPTAPPFLISAPPMEGMLEVEAGAPCAQAPEPAAGQHSGCLEACLAATTVHRGAYDRIGDVYASLYEWVSAHGYSPAGPPREVYLNGPDEVRSPEDYVTELVLPVSAERIASTS